MEDNLCYFLLGNRTVWTHYNGWADRALFRGKKISTIGYDFTKKLNSSIIYMKGKFYEILEI